MSRLTRRWKVLQAVYGLDVGGIENWLLQVLRAIDRERFEVDVLVTNAQRDAFAPQVRELGCRILPLPLSPAHSYTQRFAGVIGEYGPYDAIHSSLGLHDGWMMWLAARHGIPVRICHSRNIVYSSGQSAHPHSLPRRWAQSAYARLMRYWMLRHATHLLGVSRDAAIALFGSSVPDDPRYFMLPSSIETAQFTGPLRRQALRDELGLPKTASVMGHVGRFVEQKNHEFLVQIAYEVIQRDNSVHFLLVGDGPLRCEVEAQICALGIDSHVHVTGSRHDVPDLMRAAIDLFLLPSRWEGLGRVLIEAQLAGVPCLISDVVPTDADIVKPLITRLSLNLAPKHWAERSLALLRAPRPVTQQESFDTVAGTIFNMDIAIRELERMYSGHALGPSQRE